MMKKSACGFCRHGVTVLSDFNYGFYHLARDAHRRGVYARFRFIDVQQRAEEKRLGIGPKKREAGDD